MGKFDDLKREARALPSDEKAALARTLIDDLDQVHDEGIEQLWLDEARRRYDAYRQGDMPSVDGDEAMTRARNRAR
jgi:putative addiction module component (TIGR02574 family)